jgi:hypothetical protein
MPFTVTHDPELGIVELHFTGTISPDDLLQSSSRCFALQKEAAALRYIIDSDTWDLAVSPFDLHALPAREYPRAEIDRRTRIAVVAPTNDKALVNARFYEDACRNRGWNARIVPDRAAALAWLKG